MSSSNSNIPDLQDVVIPNTDLRNNNDKIPSLISGDSPGFKLSLQKVSDPVRDPREKRMKEIPKKKNPFKKSPLLRES